MDVCVRPSFIFTIQYQGLRINVITLSIYLSLSLSLSLSLLLSLSLSYSLSLSQMEEYLEKTVQMFSYLTDKDLFAEIYRYVWKFCVCVGLF